MFAASCISPKRGEHGEAMHSLRGSRFQLDYIYNYMFFFLNHKGTCWPCSCKKSRRISYTGWSPNGPRKSGGIPLVSLEAIVGRLEPEKRAPSKLVGTGSLATRSSPLHLSFRPAYLLKVVQGPKRCSPSNRCKAVSFLTGGSHVAVPWAPWIVALRFQPGRR